MQQVLKFDLGILNNMQPVLKSNLVLLENQFPFSVLEMLLQQVAESELEPLLELEEPLSLRKLAFEFFGEYNIHRLAFRDFNANIEHFTAFKDFNGNIERYKAFKDFYANIEHFTDLVRFFYLIERKDILGRLHGGAKVKKYTATQLHEACVTFKVVKKNMIGAFLT
nr:hypothetical protein CFP56_48045 [Quercus suber]